MGNTDPPNTICDYLMLKHRLTAVQNHLGTILERTGSTREEDLRRRSQKGAAFVAKLVSIFRGDQKGRKQRSHVLEHGAFRLRFGGLSRCSQEAVGLHGVKRLQCPVFPSSPPFPKHTACV